MNEVTKIAMQFKRDSLETPQQFKDRIESNNPYQVGIAELLDYDTDRLHYKIKITWTDSIPLQFPCNTFYIEADHQLAKNLSSENKKQPVFAKLTVKNDTITVTHMDFAELKHYTLLEEHIKSASHEIKFETVSVDSQGKIIKREVCTALQYSDDLGDDVQLEMIHIQAGTFMMGSPNTERDRFDNETLRQVNVSSFYMGKYPVTQKQWQAVMGNNPSCFKGDKLPVENVSWIDAMQFCKKLSEKTGKKYRLPTEAEWEYACRSTTTTPFHFGETITPEIANYNGSYPYGNSVSGNYREKTVDVGTFPPNPFGLYDMHGNVCEWCLDIYTDFYNQKQDMAISNCLSCENLFIVINGLIHQLYSHDSHHDDFNIVDFNIENRTSGRVIRGSSWRSYARRCRSSYRDEASPSYRYDNLGFRLVMSTL
ncbi:MAG: formylglycine-generating enzyme family protein [Desulfobacterales bacterium]|nr:formylglycine-generating enzyme family protein [Desulfobacterales bacterium]